MKFVRYWGRVNCRGCHPSALAASYKTPNWTTTHRECTRTYVRTTLQRLSHACVSCFSRLREWIEACLHRERYNDQSTHCTVESPFGENRMSILEFVGCANIQRERCRDVPMGYALTLLLLVVWSIYVCCVLCVEQQALQLFHCTTSCALLHTQEHTYSIYVRNSPMWYKLWVRDLKTRASPVQVTHKRTCKPSLLTLKHLLPTCMLIDKGRNFKCNSHDSRLLHCDNKTFHPQ